MLVRDLFQASAYCEADSFTGPVKCNDARTAWLGCGYYFWDNSLEDAKWWGETHYYGNYIVCKSAYDYHSVDYFDLVSLKEHKEYLAKVYQYLLERSRKLNRKETITVGMVIETLKRTDKSFTYRAIRACPISTSKGNLVPFNRQGDYILNPSAKYQICVIDKSFLIEEPHIIYSQPQLL